MVFLERGLKIVGGKKMLLPCVVYIVGCSGGEGSSWALLWNVFGGGRYRVGEVAYRIHKRPLLCWL